MKTPTKSPVPAAAWALVATLFASACATHPLELPPPPPQAEVVAEVPRAALPDSDGDGVPDDDDRCPGTRAGYKTDALGCPVMRASAGAAVLAGTAPGRPRPVRRSPPPRVGACGAGGCVAGDIAPVAAAVPAEAAPPAEGAPDEQPAVLPPRLKDASVLYTGIDTPLTIKRPLTLSIAASFAMNCEQLADRLQWARRLCAPRPVAEPGQPGTSVGAGSATIIGVDLNAYRFLRASLHCTGNIRCDPADPQPALPIENQLMSWNWSISATQDDKSAGLIHVSFEAAATRDGPFDPVESVVPPIDAKIAVTDEVHYWITRILRWLNDSKELLAAGTALIGGVLAFRKQLAALFGRGDPAKPDPA